MAKLLVSRDGVEMQSLDLQSLGKSEVVLGRAPECDLRFDDRAVGREHAILQIGPKEIAIHKKSKFGKLLFNGNDVQDAVVKNGEIFWIADYQVRYESGTSLNSQETHADKDGPELVSDAAPDLLDVNEGKTRAMSKGQMEAAASANVAGLDGAGGVPGLEESGSEVSMHATGHSTEQATGPALEPESGGVSNSVPGMDSQSPSSDFQADEKTSILPQAKIITKLVFKPGDANLEEFVIKKPEIVIGRGTNCDVVLTDKKSSRKHLIIKRAGLNFVAQDLGSSNGTLVNGTRITEQELAGDDVIKIGDTDFVFKALSQEYLDQEQNLLQVPQEVGTDPNMGENIEVGVPQQFSQQPMPVENVSPELQLQNAPGLENPAAAANGPKKKETLLEKFKRQPLPRKIIIVVVVLGVVIMALEPEDPKAKKKSAKPAVMEKGDAAFTALVPEKKQFVINTYELAFELYKNQEFERAAYEVDKILAILPNGYKDAKQIKEYALRGIEAQKAIEDEKRRKEAEERLRKEIAELVAEAQTLVDQGKEIEAKEVFAKVLERDPDNPTILRLQQQIEEREQQKKAAEEDARVRALKKKSLQDLIKEGYALLKAGRYYEVMEKMQDAPVLYSEDEKLLEEARNLSSQARSELKSRALPFLEKGRAAMQEGNFPEARDAFLKALQIDYLNAEAKRGINQIREILHDRSKMVYTEAVIMESVSDYKGARAKYKECLNQAMPDDIYYGRCSRKFKRFEMLERSTASSSASEERDPEKPSLPQPVGDSDE